MKRFQSLVCIGECMLELQLADAHASSAKIAIAGDSLNTAIYAKRSQPEALEVAYATALGTDAISDRMMQTMQSERLETHLIRRIKDRIPGCYAILNASDGERSFLYWREQSAARALLEDGADTFLSALTVYQAWYLSGISLAILSPDQRSVLFEAVERFRRTGGIFVFDSNYRPNLWSSVQDARETVARAWQLCDIALPSLDDEMALFNNHSEQDVLKRLQDLGVTFGAMKRGKLGPCAIGWSLDQSFPPAQAVTDTTSAGDSFNGGFLAALATGKSQQDAAMAGHRLASIVVSHKGAIIDPAFMPV